ncbi:MAG: hypothetical protein PVG92_08505 [Holophagae bacterium]|jgi:hypothetical protein
MSEGLDRARERRNILEQLAAKIPGFSGYLEAEMRREVDKLQRDWLAHQLDRARFAMNGKIRDWARKGRIENLDLAGSIEKSLDRMANRIRHADYGSSGFFDAVKIGKKELEILYEFDLALTDTVEYLALQIEQLPETADEQMLSRALDAVEAANQKFDERSTVFEDVTQTGGA